MAFVLCSFGSVAFYRIPWVVWRDMKGNFGRKYIMPADVEQYLVKIGAPGVPLFLEGLEAQSTERAGSDKAAYPHHGKPRRGNLQRSVWRLLR